MVKTVWILFISLVHLVTIVNDDSIDIFESKLDKHWNSNPGSKI